MIQMGLKSYAFIVCFFIGSFIDVSTSVPVSEASYDNIVRVSLLTEDLNPDFRVRRAADSNLPDHLSFAVPVQGDNVKLRFKRSRLLPTVTSDSLGTRNANRFSQDAAVYTDMTRGSAMIVKRDTEGYTLKGSFVHANREWSMEPVERQRRDAGERRFFRLHHLVPTDVRDTNISFVGDAVIDTEEREELVKIWRRQGKGKNQQHGQQRNRSSLLPPRETREGSSLLGQGKQLGSNEEKHRGKNRRFKRAVTQHVVETAFVVDNSDYQKWVALVGSGESITQMTLWYTYVAESLRIRYESIVDPDIAITTTVTVLKILTNIADSNFIESLTTPEGTFNGTTALHAFKDWGPLQTDIPESDHFMLFTGYNMDGTVLGRAFTSRACTASGVSIVENIFHGLVSEVAAHELGHSLSASHDSDKAPTCDDSTQNIMAASVTLWPDPGNEGNPWRFSPCSITSFKEYLSGKECTLPENTSGDDELPSPGPGQNPGEVLDRDTQCQWLLNNSDSYFCEGAQNSKGIETLCSIMYCTGDDGRCWGIVPQEYTPCNTGKWCRAGLCIDIPVEITTPTTPTTTTTTPTTTTTTPTTTTTTPTTTTSTSTTTTTPSTTTTTPSAYTEYGQCRTFLDTNDLPAFWNCIDIVSIYRDQPLHGK